MPDIELLLAGDGTELPALYASAAVAVIPSIVDRSGDQEGFGLVIVEAMGCGCAVVASDLPAIHDIVRHGQNGLLVQPGDVVDFADRIMRLLKDRELRAWLVENGREDVCKRFDWDETAAQYHKLFADLVVQTII